MEQRMAEPWVSVTQIAKHPGVTGDSIYRWMERKRLHAHRVMQLWKFRATEADNWVREVGANNVEQHSAANRVPLPRIRT
jgi:excisionase family DNA binding protein